MGDSLEVQVAKISVQMDNQDKSLERQDRTLSNIEQKLDDGRFISKAEYDLLKERVEHLENFKDGSFKAIIGAYGALGLTILAAIAVVFAGYLPLLHHG
jgi:3-phenylpropionate/cinnamic acid dioxygenase small subunit